MGLVFFLLTQNVAGKVLDKAAENIYEGLLDKDAPQHELNAGDIIGIKRYGGVYEHYAVYIGKNKVIHFAAESGDFGNATIHEAPIEDFLDGQSTFFVLDFSKAGRRPEKHDKGYAPLKVLKYGLGGALIKKAADKAVSKLPDKDIEKIYSPRETVARAKSKIGTSDYNLFGNNCEHFAIWCKTGAHKSYQVQNALNRVEPLALRVVRRGAGAIR